MGVKHIFLALLRGRPMHGYDLKESFDQLVSEKWSLNYGQVYTTLSRLERDGLVVSTEVKQEHKPDKKVYKISEAGQTELTHWLSKDPEWTLYADEAAFRIASLNLVDKETAVVVLHSHRLFWINMLRSLNELREENGNSDTLEQLLVERAILRLEADLQWVELCMKKWGR